MIDEFTKTSFCVFMRKKKCNLLLVKEKKPLEIDRSLFEKKKKAKKKNLAQLFSGAVGMSIFGINL